jgi:hypothetical protein
MEARDRRLLGHETDADQRVTLPIRHWDAMKLALWRSKVAAEQSLRQARQLLGSCRHAPRCPGAQSETESCLPECPDRERRLSVLVILAAAKQLAPIDARIPANRYIAPSREHFSAVIAELAACQAELDALRAQGHTVTPPPDGDGAHQLPPENGGTTPHQLQEGT